MTKALSIRPQLKITQEGIVFLVTVVLFAGFSLGLDNFLTLSNILVLLRSVSVLGILALGMGVVVIGRGIDLSMVATLVVGICWALEMTSNGMAFGGALLLGGAFTAATGLLIGGIVAFAEIPAVFTTLAMASVIFGLGNALFFSTDVHNAPPNVAWLQALGFGSLLGVPVVVFAFGATAILVHLLLRTTRFGRFVYAIGDNIQAARLSGLPVRPVIITQYVIAALIAYLAGLVTVASNSGMNTRLYNSTLIYDVLLVVVLGGIGLNGGRGGVRNVLVGTLLVGTLLSGMTIMNLPYAVQNLVKSLVLLVALVVDTLLNPRDEQTSQQGDI